MKKLTILITCLLAILSNAQTVPAFMWAQRLGENGVAQVASIRTDASGNVYTFGTFSGVADFDPGAGVYNVSSDSGTVYFSKLNAQGNFVWLKQLNTNIEFIDFLIDGTGNIFFSGIFRATADFDPGPGVFNLTIDPTIPRGDGFVLKLDANFNFLWVKQLVALPLTEPHVSSIPASDLFIDASNNIYVSGTFAGRGDFNPGAGVFELSDYNYTVAQGSGDVFILKLNPAGDFVWAKQLGGPAYDLFSDLVVNSAGNVFVTGNYYGFDGDFDPGAATYNLPTNGSIDAFVVNLDASGNFVWAKTFGGELPDFSGAIKLDAAQNVYVSGRFDTKADFDPTPGVYTLSGANGSYNGFVMKLKATGDPEWVKSVGGNLDYGFGFTDMEVSPVGDIYIGGNFKVTTDLNPDAGVYNVTYTSLNAGVSIGVNTFVMKLNTYGNFEWAVNTGDNECYGIELDGQNNVYIAGRFQRKVDFDPGPGVLYYEVPAPFGNYPQNSFVTKLGATITAINELKKTSAGIIYPNPTTGSVHISLQNSSGNEQVEIYNDLGMLLYKQNNTSGIIDLDLTSQPKGIYFVKIINANGTVSTEKLIKQ